MLIHFRVNKCFSLTFMNENFPIHDSAIETDGSDWRVPDRYWIFKSYLLRTQILYWHILSDKVCSIPNEASNGVLFESLFAFTSIDAADRTARVPIAVLSLYYRFSNAPRLLILRVNEIIKYRRFKAKKPEQVNLSKCPFEVKNLK